jgi:hypothetical protein
MNKKTQIIVLLVTGCCTVLFFVLNNKTAKQGGAPQEKYAQVDEFSTRKEAFLKRNKDLNEKLMNTPVPDIACQDDSSEYRLPDLASKGSVLVFKYSELNCNPCYEAELATLHEVFEEENDKVVILCSYREKKHFTIFKRVNKIKLPIYRIPQDAFSWELEDYGVPYYFILHPDMSISDIYTPENIFPELNREYVENAKQLLSKQK